MAVDQVLAESSVLEYRFGEAVSLTEPDFERLLAVSFSELERTFV